MKKLIICILLLFTIIPVVVLAQNNEQNVNINYEKKRNWIIPAYVNLQYAGGIGNYIIGGGYTLNKAQSIRFALKYGFVPKFKSEKNLHISTIEFCFLPVKVKVEDRVSVMPRITLAVSRVFADGPGTFTRLPSYYPEGYYAPNAFRFHFSLGVTGRYQLNKKNKVKALEFYIETTTNDLYMRNYFCYADLHFTNMFTMALGVNVMFK